MIDESIIINDFSHCIYSRCMYVCMYVRTYVCMYVSQVCMYVCMYVGMYVGMYIYIYSNIKCITMLDRDTLRQSVILTWLAGKSTI